MHQTIDSLHFWEPTYELSCDDSFYDEVRLTFEGAFELVQHEERTYVTREASEKLIHLTTLVRQKISSFLLAEPNDLVVEFVVGVKLRVTGDNGPFESWKLQARVNEEKVLAIAGPGERLSLFE